MALVTSISGEPNRLSLAISELKQYYGDIGRSDISKIVITDTTETTTSITDEFGEVSQETTTVTTNRVLDPKSIDDLIFVLLDNTEGAYFTWDLLTDDQLLQYFQITGDSSDFENTHKVVKVLYEPSGAIKDKEYVISDGFSGYVDDESEGMSIADMVNPRSTDPDNSGVVNHDFAVNNRIAPDRYTGPGLTAFVFPHHSISPSTRSTAAISMYMNSIPTLERSRCVPYINIQFVSVVDNELGKRTSQLSTLRFLGMNQKDNEFDKIGLRAALPSNVIESLENDDVGTVNKSVSASGMELFTSPQTLVNMDINSSGFSGPAGNVLNKLAPLMTLESVTFDIVGLGQDLFAYKTGLLTFTLHDRSRMADIAPIIAADLFSSTYLVMEYGWSHPDGGYNSDNVYGSFLNSLRSRGAFNIISTNFSIADDGQVRFTLKFVSRGAGEVLSYPIATGPVMPIGQIKEVFKRYVANRLEGDQDKEKISPEVRQKLRIATSSASSSSTVVYRDLFNKIQEQLKSQSVDSVASLSDINELIKELIGDSESGDGTLNSKSKASLVQTLREKLEGLTSTKDPFLSDPPSYYHTIEESVPEFPVSLGKVLMAFVGYPLAGTGKFDEVQMMFYKFNDQSIALRNYESIANFIIDSDELSRLVMTYAEKFPAIGISSFMTRIVDNIVTRLDNPNYGLQDLKKKAAKIQDDNEKSDEAKQNDLNEVSIEITERIKEIYKGSGGGSTDIKIPKIRLSLECVPAYVKNVDTDRFEIDNSKNILRVHVFDAAATPYADELLLLKAINNSDIASTVPQEQGESTESDNSSGNTSRSGTLDQAVEDGTVKKSVKEGSGGLAYIIPNAPTKSIKELIKQVVPSITFGSMFTSVAKIGMQSSTSGHVNNVLLLNATNTKNEDHNVPGRTIETEDVIVIPSNADITTLGCPLFEYGQHFFVDMGTGTTADNMYYVTKISHTITPGEFNTNIGLTFSASGTISAFRNTLEATQKKMEEKEKEESSSVQ